MDLQFIEIYTCAYKYIILLNEAVEVTRMLQAWNELGSKLGLEDKPKDWFWIANLRKLYNVCLLMQ